jgi:hypothetical protein
LQGRVLPKQEFELLCQCLKMRHTAQDIDALRDKLQQQGYSKVLQLAMELRLEASLSLALRNNQLLPNIPKLTLPDGRTTITKTVDDILSLHGGRRAAMRERLLEIVGALNKNGIVPTLIKGARSLWTGLPAWRSLLDLDILIPGAQADQAQRILEDMGYAKLKRTYIHLLKHHLPELFRDDLPGWVEIHRRISVRFAEALLPTEMVVKRQEIASLDPETTVGLLQVPDHVLQAIVHHHFHHDEFRNRGWLDVKGLYEFAADITALDEGQRTELLERAAVHPRLLAALDLWLAAASDLFGCPIEAPMKIHADAAKHWSTALKRMTGAEKGFFLYPGHGEEVALCFNRERLTRTKSGQSRLGRTQARLKVLASLANNSYPNTIVLPRRWL